MSFSDNVKEKIRDQYISSDKLVENFYEPVLSEATLYQRVSGYFSTSGVDLYAEGLEELAKNNGEVQFIISKEISKQDFKSIQDGYALREELKPLRISERNDRLSTETQKKLGNLAFMIANGKARVKVALTDAGIFHDKFGIITSGDEKIFFNGSVNETQNGISKNYESISVDVSWDESQNVQSRLDSNVERFKRLWNDGEDGIKVIEASELAYEEIAQYQSQSSIIFEKIADDIETENIQNKIIFKLYQERVVRLDRSDVNFTKKDRKLRQGSDLSEYFEDDNATIKDDVSYRDIENIIEVTKKRAVKKKISVEVSDAVKSYLNRKKYSIEQYKILGSVYKHEIAKFPVDKRSAFDFFSDVVQKEVERPLRDLHLRAAYYEYEMARAANFSVPGAGKTAMLLGVFAYLNSSEVYESEKIDRLLVISPLNAFESWRSEFKAVFGDKKELVSFDSKSTKNFEDKLNTDWGISNLILVNYESLISNAQQLKRLIDDKTMLVFDEVHRIKNPEGKRAAAALEISENPRFKYVLTGTPIPNKYRDIYNILKILYGNEYNFFFGWEPNQLLNPKVREIEEINEKIYPFFWRTNKKDLNVPAADPDIKIVVEPSREQKQLAEEIYFNEQSSLAKLIRLIQASTNPSLVTEAIDYNEIMSFDDEEGAEGVKGISESEFKKLFVPEQNGEDVKDINEVKYSSYDNYLSPKFLKGIELVVHLVSQGKKVLVWGIFVDTLNKITESLRENNISVNLVFGGTNKSDRVGLINQFRDGDVQVLVSNPQTLGESISLHQTVHDAVYFEYDFNLTFMLQSRDRIHRLGLDPDKHTRYYYLQTAGEDSTSDCPGFIDEKIYGRLKDKESVMYDAIDNNTLSVEYSENEILDAIKIIDEERKRINQYHEWKKD